MGLRFPTQIAGSSPFVYRSDYDDKETSDRNHKHRRKEDAWYQYRKGNKPFQNGHIYEETGSQVNETSKKSRFNPLENDIAVKFDQRHPGFTRFTGGPSVLNQKDRVNQPLSCDHGIVRGRGTDSGLWSQRDPSFSSSEMVQSGSVPRSLFAETGLPTVSNSYGPTSSPYGLIPELQNSGLDMQQPLGSQGTFRPTIDPSLNMGLARQWCRDFEEQGFCLRGDMCTMEHGLNHIVVDDILSLSQFNLPASMTEKNTLLSSEGPHGKNINYGMGDNGLDLSGTSIDSDSASDFYDPDQPLLENDSLISTGLRSIIQPNIGKTDSLLDPGSSNDSDNEGLRNCVSGVGFSTTRSLGSNTSIRKRTEMGENTMASDFFYLQSLSQFNLPVSLASESVSIAPVGTGPSPTCMTEGNALLSSEGPHGKNINYGMGDNGLDVRGTSIDSDSASDFYDPDQPLLRNPSLTSTGLRTIIQPNIGKTDSLLDPGLSDDSDNEGLSNSASGVGFSNTRSLGSNTSIRKRAEMGKYTMASDFFYLQSLSQFNLPVSLSSESVSISPVGTGRSPAFMTEENTLLSSEGPHGKNINYGMGDNGLDVSGISIDSDDFYNPDQPLLGNDSLTSTGHRSFSQPNIGKTDSLLDPGSSVDSNNEGLSNSMSGVEFSNTRSLGSNTSIRKRMEMGENMILRASPSSFLHNDTMDSPVPSISTRDPPYHQKLQNVDSSLKMQRGIGRMLCKPSQKAQRTLFVTGIPQQNNRRESLHSHFKKFGEVSAINIPSNSEHAFVQFSKTEEAKAALLAPDAVLGNRFIKLWWANHDNIQDIETIIGNNMSACPRGSTASSISHYSSVGNKRKDDSGSISHKSVIAPSPASNHPNPVVADDAKVPPPLQKKMEILEVLKEEIRKRQELPDQKRSHFRCKLDKLVKQASGLKGEVAPEHVAKTQKLGVLIS